MTSLTEKEERAVATIRELLSDGTRASISDVASRCGCAPSTISYLAKKLGYSGWIDMSHQLRHGHASFAEATFEVNEKLETLCSLMRRNSQHPIFVDAVGDGTPAGLYLSTKLAERGFLPVGFSEPALSSHVFSEGTGLMFAINESGIALAGDCGMARARGLEVVSLTRNASSPTAAASTISVVIRDNKTPAHERYEPNFFCARTIVYFEMLFSLYDRASLTGTRLDLD